MFQRLTSEPFLSDYSVEVLSSPEKSGGPWVITMDNVITDQETERLIQLGAEEGYRRSTDVGQEQPDGSYNMNINEGRTSENAWCIGTCLADSTGQNVTQRLSTLTGIPGEHSEYLQLLRYQQGQYYQIHHDYITHQVGRFNLSYFSIPHN